MFKNFMLENYSELLSIVEYFNEDIIKLIEIFYFNKNKKLIEILEFNYLDNNNYEEIIIIYKELDNNNNINYIKFNINECK